jgi:hypothetical protein
MGCPTWCVNLVSDVFVLGRDVRGPTSVGPLGESLSLLLALQLKSHPSFQHFFFLFFFLFFFRGIIFICLFVCEAATPSVVEFLFPTRSLLFYFRKKNATASGHVDLTYPRHLILGMSDVLIYILHGPIARKKWEKNYIFIYLFGY